MPSEASTLSASAAVYAKLAMVIGGSAPTAANATGITVGKR